MNGHKSKHVSMPGEMHDRVTAITQKTGATFSRMVQAALKEKLPEWEKRLGNFDLEDERAFEIRMMESLIERSIEKVL